MSTAQDTVLLNLFRQISTISVLNLPDELELSRPAINLLKWIHSSPGCGVVDIARGMQLSPPTISVGIRRLVNEGWLERRHNTSDRRMQQIYLTEKSQALLDGLKSYQKTIFADLISSLSADEKDQLVLLLSKAVGMAE
jgi:DNA-binding MarR family transcriptional regulator